MRYVALFLLTVSIASAETDFYCAMSPASYSKSLFQNKRTARAVKHWTCTITNYSDSPIVLTEGSVIRALHTAGVPAYSVESVRNMFLENQRRGKWKTIGRILTYAANGATLVAAADIANMSDNWRIGLTLGAQSLPTLARAAGSRAPSIELFERVAWTVQIGIEPHSTVAVSMFSGPWDGKLIINGVFAESLPSASPASPALLPTALETPAETPIAPEDVVVCFDGLIPGRPAVCRVETWIGDPSNANWSSSTVTDPMRENANWSSSTVTDPMREDGVVSVRTNWASPDHVSRYGRL